MAEIENQIKAQIDITDAVSNLNSLVRECDKSLKKIDKLSEDIGKGLSDNLVPVKDLRVKYRQLESETSNFGKNLQKSLKIKADVDSSSIASTTSQLKNLTNSIKLDTNIGSSVDSISLAFANLGSVIGNSASGVAMMNTATIAATTSGVNYGAMAAANAVAISGLNSVNKDYTTGIKLNNDEVNQAIDAADNYQSVLAKSLITIRDTTTSEEERIKVRELLSQVENGLTSDAQRYLNSVDANNQAQQLLTVNTKKSVTVQQSLSNAFNKSKDSVTNFFKSAQPLGEILKSLPGPLGGINTALIATVSSMSKVGVVAKSLIATPLGAVITVIAVAFAKLNSVMDTYNFWLKNAKEGNDALAERTEYATAKTAKFNQVAGQFGTGVVSVINDIINGFDDFVSSVGDFFFTNFAGVMDLWYGKGFSEEWLKVKKDVKKDSEEAAKVIKSIREQEESIEIQRANTQRDIAKNRAIVADIDNTTAQQRLAAAKQILTLENSLVDIESELTKKRLNLQKLQNSYGDTNYEDAKKEKDLEAELIKLDAKRAEAQRQYLLTAKRINKEKGSEIINTTQLVDVEVNRINPDTPLFNLDNLTPQLDNLSNLISGALNNTLNNINTDELNWTKSLSISDLLFKGDNDRSNELDELDISRWSNIINSNEALLNSVNLTEEERTRIEEENANARMSISQIEADAKARSAEALMGILYDLEAAFDDHTIANKAAASASTIISGIQAAQNSFTALAPIPIVGPALGIAAASASALATAKRVKDIWKVKKNDKNMPTDASSTAQSVQSTLIRPVETNMATSDIALQKQLNQTQRVELVYSDVQSAAKRVQVVNNESSF